MNPLVTAIEPSVIRAIAARKRSDSIDLGLGEPTLFPEMRHFEAAMAWVREHGTRYSVNAGDAALRERIAAHYAYPEMESPENVCITTGSQEAVYVAIKTMCDPATDEVLVVEPAFPAYAKVAALEGIAVRRVAMTAENGFAFDVQAIAAAVTARTRLIVICSPCNPTARVLTDRQARELAAALGARGGEPVYVLHDEVYREQVFVDDAGSMAAHYPHTIVVNSLSKSNALTGMRVGWILARRDVAAAAVKTHAWVTSSANAFSQRIAFSIFSSPEGVREQSAWYRTHRDLVLEALRASGLRFVAIDGSFYAFVSIGECTDTLAFAHRLIDERNVVAIPGSIFSAASEGWLRLSWVARADRVHEGIARIAEAIAEAR